MSKELIFSDNIFVETIEKPTNPYDGLIKDHTISIPLTDADGDKLEYISADNLLGTDHDLPKGVADYVRKKYPHADTSDYIFKLKHVDFEGYEKGSIGHAHYTVNLKKDVFRRLEVAFREYQRDYSRWCREEGIRELCFPERLYE